MRTFKAVFFALLGVRGSKEHEQDASQLKLHNIVIVGIFAVLVFIATLLVWVNSMLS